ncbi:MAG: hypothetical protein NVV74_07050 [Magnetospirillum sp.]|nr:hypothetical protein [Magnetospirillum sp.]
MSRISALLLVLVALAAPARAAEDVRPVAQVPLVPVAEGPNEPLDVLLRTFWAEYYNAAGDNAFGRNDLRVGLIDLNGDGRGELVLMVDAPGWEAEQGNPFVVAEWRNKRWIAVGWGWGDEDTVFATTEVLGGWRSIDGGKVTLRWSGREYAVEAK